MNIGFDASRAFTKNRTGTENYSYQILHNLSLIDHINTYYVYIQPDCHPSLDAGSIPQKDMDSGSKAGMTKVNKNIWPANFKFITIPYPRLWTQVGLAKQTFIDHLDVLFVPSHTLPLIRKPGLKTILTVHDLGAEYLPQTHQLKQRLYLKLMTDFQLQSATRLIAVSQATRDDLTKKVGINPQKISVIYEGYNEKLFQTVKNEILRDVLKDFDLEPGKYFLFVGTIQPRKNLIRLIKAYAKFIEKLDNPNSSFQFHNPSSNLQHPTSIPQLVLAGSKGWLSDEIYLLPKKLGIEDQVKFLGYVPDEKLSVLYSGAIALLFPSLFEGFGLPILEAMACKCPVLTSNTSSMPEVVGSAGILVNPYSEEEIAQGISRLFSDQILTNKLKDLGIAQVKKFSWEKCARQILQLLQQITSS